MDSTTTVDVKVKVFKIVSQVFKTPLDQVNEDSSPDTIASWDSLEYMNLILALEEAFKVQFSAEDIGEMQNVGLILVVLKEKGVH